MLPEKKTGIRERARRTDEVPRIARYPSPAGPESWVGADEDTVSLVDIWRILVRYRWVILAVMLLSTLAAGGTALWMTPMYRAEAVLAPVTDMDEKTRYSSRLSEFSGIAALAGINVERGGRKNEAIASLKSRLLTQQFIHDEKLLPVLFHRLWDEKAQRWSVDDPEDVPTLWDAWKLFDEDVRRVYEDKKTGLVILSVEWEDPQQAASWANELVRRTNAMMRQRAAEESQQSIRYLREQLEKTSIVELQQVLNHMVEAEMKESILANINEEYAFRLIDPAAAPEEPFRPKVAPMVVLGAVLGLMGGILLALFLNFLRLQREATPGEA